jgi:hypothetical protein
MGQSASLETRQRMRRAHLSRRQQLFVQAYADLGSAAGAARQAGYKPRAAKEMGYENLTKPHIKSAVEAELAKIGVNITPGRVQRRLDEISHAAQAAGQFGPAVRSEELLGRSLGMFIDRNLQLTGQLNDSHVTALLELAKRRRAEPIDLVDDEQGHARGGGSDSE